MLRTLLPSALGSLNHVYSSVDRASNPYVHVYRYMYTSHPASSLCLHPCLVQVNVYDLGLLLFRDEVVHHGTVRKHLQRTLMEMVHMERKGVVTNRSGFGAL